MSTYLNILTNEYPRHQGDLELLGWKIEEGLPENWVEVIIDPTPEINENQIYEANFPQKIDGVWKVTWTVRNLTEEELSQIQIRISDIINQRR